MIVSKLVRQAHCLSSIILLNSFHAEASADHRRFCIGEPMATRNRPDKDGKHRAQFDKNKKRIYATQSVCGICGKPVDFSLKYPHPLSPTIDHIIPIDKGGHPSDIANLQLAHFTCNRQKSNKVRLDNFSSEQQTVISNRLLPATFDWTSRPPAPMK